MPRTQDDERLPDPMMIDEEDEEVVSAPIDDTVHHSQDGPMGRVTIDMIELNELDQLISTLRARRLERVEQARQLSRARQFAEYENDLARFDKLLTRVRNKLDKMEQDETKLVEDMNKLRAMAIGLEG